MKKRQSVWKKGLSLLVSGAMLLSLCPAGAWAIDSNVREGINTRAAGKDRTVMLGTSGISSYSNTGVYDYIYFGDWKTQDSYTTSSPIKWRVLDAHKGNAVDATTDSLKDAAGNPVENTNAMFLLSEELLGSGEDGGVYFAKTKSSGKAWQGSDAQEWCQNFVGDQGNGASAFTSSEQKAILETTKSDDASTGSIRATKFAASQNILNGDKVFFLSAEEAQNRNYGFIDESAQVANYGKSAVRWWLRSPVYNDSPCAGVVINTGYVRLGYVLNDACGARPAFNLNRNAILFTAAAVDGKSAAGMENSLTAVQAYPGNEWKLTLLDSSRSNFTASLDPSLSGNKVEAGGTVTISYSDAQTGSNEYVSAMLTDGSGAVFYYGRIAHTQSETNGTANITIPSDLASGIYTLKVFSEQYNGDKETDYASNFVNIDLTVDGTGTGTTEPGQGGSDTSSDTIAPTLSEVGATRTGEAEATVTFTSSKAGTYYYIVADVAESNATDPTKEAILAGEKGACAEGKNTLYLTGLAGTGEKYIYILARDEANNTSQNVLKITIPAYKKPTLSPDELDFGSLKVGYTAPQEQTVTIKNNGNYPITLTQPTAVQPTEEYFTISTLKTDTQTIDMLSSTQLTLNANETATFTVQPTMGYGAGEYSEIISISGNWATSSGTTGGITGGTDTDWDGDEEVEIPIQTYQLMTNGISDSGEGADVTLTLTARFTVVAPVLEVSAPTFDSVQTGYAQPEAQAITIKNTGDADAQITSVTVDNTAAFTITGSGDSVAANSSIKTWLVQPNAGLTKGTHTGTIAVIYDNGEKATATVSFTVSEKALYSVIVNDSYATQSGAGRYAAGETVSIAAGERSGYRFAGWTSQDNVEFADESGANTTFTMPAEAVTVTANWKKTGGDPEPAPQTYTIAVRAEPEEGGTVAVKSTAAEAAGGAFVSVALAKGTEVTVTAAPNAGYRFVCWMDAEDSEVSGKVSHTFTVTADCTLTAVFEQEPTPEPTPGPTPEPSPEPTPEPTPEPSPEPTQEPSPEPDPEPNPDPTPTPSPEPSPAPEAPMEDSADGNIEAFIGAAVTIGGGAAWMAYQYREALPIWKLAGVVLLADEAAGAAGAASAAAPVANATVALYQDGQLVKTLTTDANGLFAVRLPKGTYEAVAIWEKDGVIHTARRELTAETLLDGRDTAVQQIVLTDKAEEPNG